MERKLVVVSQLIGNYGITLDDGDVLYAAIQPLLAGGYAVDLDFQGVTIFASPFFNAAIGRLLSSFSSDQLNANLNPINLSSAGTGTLRRVIENAKSYYGSPAVKDAVDRVLDERAMVA